MELEQLYKLYLENPNITTDTRAITNGSVFFALKGANFNGNKFAKEALDKGAAIVVVDEQDAVVDERCVLVSDVLTTLQDLARYHRSQLNIPVIGVTGTNGKTTTKELLHAVLAEKFKTFATKGNLNNHIGVPLSILAIDNQYEIAIIEMGANHIHEIEHLCTISQPTHGLISNVGKAHLEGFGSFEGVKIAKGELYDWLQNHGGTVFLQADNTNLMDMANARHFSKIVTYGFSQGNDVQGQLLKADPLLSFSWKSKTNDTTYRVQSHLTGSYNLENFLAAVAVGLHFEVAPKLINQGMEKYRPTNNRSQIVKTASNTVICDFYNANATSMAAALDNMRVIEADKKALVLGDMFELGKESFLEHQRVVENARLIFGARIIFVGNAFMEHACEGAEFYRTTEDAKMALVENPIQHAVVLLKASRGMAFEKLMEVL